jgi:hypothetical protein
LREWNHQLSVIQGKCREHTTKFTDSFKVVAGNESGVSVKDEITIKRKVVGVVGFVGGALRVLSEVAKMVEALRISTVHQKGLGFNSRGVAPCCKNVS